MLSSQFVYRQYGGGAHSVMVKAMDCRIVVRGFELHSHYYIDFWTNTLGKGINPLILLAMFFLKNSTGYVLREEWLWN